MSYVERTDEELLALARDGVAAAFAVLLYRHGHEVLALAEEDPDPIGAVVATYIHAMRSLPEATPDDVRGWLLGHAAEEIKGEVRLPAGAAAGGPSPAAGRTPSDGATSPIPRDRSRADRDAKPFETDEALDEVWAEIALRWPDGRVPRHLPSWAIWLTTTLVLLALAVLVPWAVLGATGGEEAIEELRASPVLEDLTFPEEVIEEEEPEPLPTFEFPEVPEGTEPEPEPESAPAPAPEPEPEPDPVPEEELADDAEDEPEDSEEPVDEDAPGETDETDGTDDTDDTEAPADGDAADPGDADDAGTDDGSGSDDAADADTDGSA